MLQRDHDFTAVFFFFGLSLTLNDFGELRTLILANKFFFFSPLHPGMTHKGFFTLSPAFDTHWSFDSCSPGARRPKEPPKEATASRFFPEAGFALFFSLSTSV